MVTVRDGTCTNPADPFYLRIVRPLPAQLDGYDLSRFQMFVTYEVASPLCELLVMHGYAVLDTRPGDTHPLTNQSPTTIN